MLGNGKEKIKEGANSIPEVSVIIFFLNSVMGKSVKDFSVALAGNRNRC